MPNPVVGPCLPSALNEEQANIANSSHYIDSLLDIIGAADDFNALVVIIKGQKTLSKAYPPKHILADEMTQEP
uniref:Uncharacterized protein n=1 Tax=Ditylenchus dipsaci TaxID=166011 RepID=A0A915E1P3_9BILA